MTGLPWFKCYPRDFNDGMLGLTLEERGAYITILNVIYARGGPIDDDASYFRALLCCSPKAWAKIRASLLVKRKLFEVNLDGVPSLMNARAAVEIEENLEMRRKFSERGSRGGQKSQAVSKENKELAQAQVDLGSTIEETEAESEKNTTVTNVPVVARKRGSKFVPTDWEPKPAHSLKAQTLGLDLHEQAAAFRDFEFRDAKQDFDLAFHRWLRNARNFNHAKPDKLTAKLDNLDRGFRAAERATEFLATRRAF